MLRLDNNIMAHSHVSASSAQEDTAAAEGRTTVASSRQAGSTPQPIVWREIPTKITESNFITKPQFVIL